LQIDQELIIAMPWLGWHPFLTHGVTFVDISLILSIGFHSRLDE